MKKVFKKIIYVFLISFYFLKVNQVQPLVPYYFFPTTKNLSKEPMIAVKKIHAEKVMSIYTDFAWSQISPYIRFIEGDV